MCKQFISLVSFLCLLLAGGCDREVEIQPSGKVIRLGVVGPFSGEHAGKGNNAIEGISVAMQYAPLLNNGDKLELVIEDDQNKPEQTVAAVDRLVNEKHVSAIILMSTSESALEIRSQVNKLEIPVLAMLATHPDVTRDNNYISQLCFDDVFQASVAALFVMDELLLDTAAVFTNEESQHSSILAAEFIRKYQTVGGKVIDTILVHDDQNYKDKLEFLREKGTRLLYLPVTAKTVIEIQRAATEIGWNPVIMSSDGLAATVFNDYRDVMSLLEGIYAIDFIAQDDKTIDKVLKNASFWKKLDNIYKSQNKDVATTYTALGAESLMLLSNALNRCEDPQDRSCINRMLRNTKNFQGMAGKVSILENGKASRPLVVNAIRDGRLDFIVKVY